MPRRRRQRWEAKLSHHTRNSVETRHILAYSAEGVRNFYERSGYTVLEVSTVRRTRTTERPANKPWRVNERAIREAAEFLGLTLPVRIKPTNHAGGRYGCHELRPEGPGVRIKNGRIYGIENATGLFHHITAKAWRSAQEANETLWHELAHAMQAERELSKLAAPWDALDGLRAWAACADRGRGTAYARKPVEREARSYEQFAAEHPLTVEL